jgi:serine/threonine protein kinase
MNDEDSARVTFLRTVLSDHGYDLIEQIGAGSYGRVYSVRSQQYENVVFAAKVMTLENPDSNSSIFETEIEILTRLFHPHIVSLFDSFHVDHDYFLILEYCVNGTIDKYIQAQNLSKTQVLAMFRPILSAVSYCHEQGIVLRDIKPANILIDHYGRPKLVDFGLSRIVKIRDSANYAGSLAYMAPELFMKRHDLNLFSADIWSLGITLYRLIVGDSPWPHMLSTSQLITAILAGGPPIPQTLDPPIRAVLERITARDPSARPTATELLKDPAFPEIDLTAPAPIRRRIPFPKTRGVPRASTFTPLRPPRALKPGEKRGSEVLSRSPALLAALPQRRRSVGGIS